MTEAHYFAPEPMTPIERRSVEFTVCGQDYRLTAAGGVFSAGRLDPGTAVLLRKAPLPRPGPAGPDPGRPRVLLDLGCGYGPIAVVLATVSRSTVVAVDVNRRALDLVAENAAAAGVGALVRAVHPDQVEDNVVFDEIWSNPPIRIGKAELYALLDRWLPRLAPGGVAWLVVSRNLGGDTVHRWLEGRGWQVSRHASQKGYRVLRVTGPPVR